MSRPSRRRSPPPTFTRGWLRLANNAETQKLFDALTGDERRHRQLLEAQYKPPPASLCRRAGPPDPHSRRRRRDALAGGPDPGHQRRGDAFLGYSKSADAESDQATRALYRQLAEDEAGHRRLLEAEYAARIGQPFSDYELESWVRE